MMGKHFSHPHRRTSLRISPGGIAQTGEILTMSANRWFQIGLYLLAIFLVTKPLGMFMVRVFEREKTLLDPLLRPIERVIYRLCGVDETEEMGWTEYGTAMLLFSGASLILLYFVERVRQWLPLNPQKFASVAPDLAWNTAVSFTTNTNWQAYVPETTMSYLTQMAGLAYQPRINVLELNLDLDAQHPVSN